MVYNREWKISQKARKSLAQCLFISSIISSSTDWWECLLSEWNIQVDIQQTEKKLESHLKAKLKQDNKNIFQCKEKGLY